MKVSVLKKEELKHQYTVAIASDIITKAVNDRLQQIGQNAKMDGFRPGKVPLPVLKQRYGQQIMGEILESQVQATVGEALKQQKVQPAMQPNIKVLKFGEDEGLEYEITVEVLPEIKQIDYSKLTLEKPVSDVTEEEIQDALKRFAHQFKESKPITEKRAVKDGDVALVDFVGRLDGEEFPGGSGTDTKVIPGSNTFLKDFEEGVLGMKAGNTKTVDVHFPPNYGTKKLQDQTAQFEITLKEIHEESEPELNDALAEKAGFESMAKLKDAIKNHIESEYTIASRTKAKRNLLDQLADKFTFEVPQGMLQAEFENIVKQFRQSQGLPAEQSAEQDVTGDMDDETKAEFRSIAERRVRLGLVLADVGHQQGINVNDDEIRDAIIKEAQMYPGHEQRIVEFYQKNPQAASSLSAPILEEKVVDYIFETATVKDKKVTRDELFSAEEEELPQAAASKAGGQKKSSAGKSKSTAKKEPAKKAAASKKAAPKKAAEKKEPAAKKPAAKKTSAKKAPAKKPAAKKKK